MNRRGFFFVFALTLAASTTPGQSAWAGIAENPLYVSAQAGRLTVKATDAPLAAVMRALAEKTDIRVYGLYADPSLASEKITVEFHDLTLEKGIGRILAGHNSVLMFSGKTISDSASRHRLTDVWVLKRGQDAAHRQMVSENEYDGALLSLALEGIKSPDSSTRRETIETLGEKQVPAVIPDMLNRLNDSDQGVRLAALNAMENLIDLDTQWVDRLVDLALENPDPEIRMAVISSSIPLPYAALVDHALHDRAPQVRIVALQALQGEKESVDVTRQALKDPDASVQTTAKEILDTLNQ